MIQVARRQLDNIRNSQHRQEYLHHSLNRINFSLHYTGKCNQIIRETADIRTHYVYLQFYILHNCMQHN